MDYFIFWGTQEEWRIVFFICGGINLIGAVFYLIFAQGEVQEWAKSKQILNDMKCKIPPTINTFDNDKKYLSETDARELECGTINEGYSNDAPVVSEFNIETKF